MSRVIGKLSFVSYTRAQRDSNSSCFCGFNRLTLSNAISSIKLILAACNTRLNCEYYETNENDVIHLHKFSSWVFVSIGCLRPISMHGRKNWQILICVWFWMCAMQATRSIPNWHTYAKCRIFAKMCQAAIAVQGTIHFEQWFLVFCCHFSSTIHLHWIFFYFLCWRYTGILTLVLFTNQYNDWWSHIFGGDHTKTNTTMITCIGVRKKKELNILATFTVTCNVTLI